MYFIIDVLRSKDDSVYYWWTKQQRVYTQDIMKAKKFTCEEIEQMCLMERVDNKEIVIVPERRIEELTLLKVAFRTPDSKEWLNV